MINNNVQTTIERCADLLKEQHKTIALAECATAGLIAHSFSITKNGRSILKGGVICCDTQVKQQLLGVPESIIEKYTSESQETTQAITAGLKNLIKADYYIGITGMSRPGSGESAEKPIGTVFTCLLSGEGNTVSDRALFMGGEQEIFQKIVENTAELIIHRLHLDKENK